jgi:hypothetical protein
VARDRVRQPTGAALGIYIVFSNGCIKETKLAPRADGVDESQHINASRRSDGTRSRDLRRDRPLQVQRRLPMNRFNLCHLRGLLALEVDPHSMVA